jgi:hypothetical protein
MRLLDCRFSCLLFGCVTLVFGSGAFTLGESDSCSSISASLSFRDFCLGCLHSSLLISLSRPLSLVRVIFGHFSRYLWHVVLHQLLTSRVSCKFTKLSFPDFVIFFGPFRFLTGFALYRLVVFDAVHNSLFLCVSLTWLLSRLQASLIFYLLLCHG